MARTLAIAMDVVDWLSPFGLDTIWLKALV